ncbi:hypothetical protein ACIOGZ_22385 [Kitasatospora sp. NPDC088160]|uniref:hypothetical protein n=1 Tax=Kitasatospora sp. NPDC088160 TaxID=3364072 RepID=UPI0037FE2E60
MITGAGATEFETWLRDPVAPEPNLRSVLFTKVVLALMLGRDAEEYLDTQRAAHLRRMRERTELRRTGALVDALLADHGLFHLDALRWIDLTAARLDAPARLGLARPGRHGAAWSGAAPANCRVVRRGAWRRPGGPGSGGPAAGAVRR